jgi:hypothetical protein
MSRLALPTPRSGSRRLFGGILLLASLAAAGCTDRAQASLARRILQDHRARARVKPLAAAQLVRMHLASPAAGASGDATIQWDGENFRETVTSAGLTTVRGIQGGKGYFQDEDGVTRVVAEPFFSELVTRFYFWKRGYLFDDQERARVSLGPADDATVSVRIVPRGGEPLLLTFDRRDLRLRSARSRRLDLVFSSATRFRDSSRQQAAVDGEIVWIGLPTGPLSDTEAGGWSGRWGEGAAEAPFARLGRSVTFPARISGELVTLALDAAEDGPLRVRAGLADRLHLVFARDVFGRTVARGARLAVGGFSYDSLAVERSDALGEGIDAAAGAVFFRETVVEIDPNAGLARFHDPVRWVSANGFFRALVDDDGNRPAAIVRRKGQSLRLLAPTAIAGPLLLTPQALARLGLSGPVEISGLHLGMALPPLPAIPSTGSEADFGEDGRLGWDLVLRFHVFFDLPHRWMYLKPRT